MAIELASPSLKDEIVNADGTITRNFYNYILSLTTRLVQSAFAVIAIHLTGQTGAIGVTAAVASAAAGNYRVSCTAQITTPASVNSSLTPTVSYTQNGIACTQAGTALVSNATNLPGSWSFLIKADAGTPISYSVAYVSNLAGMVYDLDVIVESVG